MSNHVISTEDFLQLEGLLSLGKRHVSSLQYLEGEIQRITGDEDAGSEALWFDEDAKDIVKSLSLMVADIES